MINFFLLLFLRKTHNGPLDMRMDVQSGGLTAADVVNNLSVEELTDIIETVFPSPHSLIHSILVITSTIVWRR
jgi:MraW methylase family